MPHSGVEMFKKSMDYGEAGDNVGALLRGVKREDVKRGQVLCAPGSVETHDSFEAEVYVLNKDEGGRHTPFFNNYRYSHTHINMHTPLARAIAQIRAHAHIQFVDPLAHPTDPTHLYPSTDRNSSSGLQTALALAPCMRARR